MLKRTRNFITEWYIPINFALKTKPDFQNLTPEVWLVPSESLDVHINMNDWLIVNKEASYYYLVNYDNKNWKMLASALNSENFGNIPPLTRAKLLYDAFTMAMVERLKYSVALELIKYIKHERDYIVLSSFFYVFDFFYRKFSEVENFHHLQVSVHMFY